MIKPRANKSNPSGFAPQFRDLRKAITYAFRIRSVRPSYSCQIMPVGDHDVVREYWDYEITTTCVAPAKVAGRQTAMKFLGRRDQLDQKFRTGAPVGLLTLRGKVSEFEGWLPLDSLHWAMQHATAGYSRYVTIIADPLNNGRAEAHVLSFEPDLDPHDFPGVEGNE